MRSATICLLAAIVLLPSAAAWAAEEKLVADDEQIDRLIDEAPAKVVGPAAAGPAKAIADKLAAHVAELAGPDHLAPLWYFNGSQATWMFAQPRETFEALAPALAVLEGKPREGALALLDRELEKCPPLDKPFYPVEGLRRFPFNAGAETRKGPASAVSKPQPIFAAYGLWAYAYYGERAEKVLPQWAALRKAMSEYQAKPLEYKFDWDRDNESQLNRAIAAMIGVARLARLAKDDETFQAARKELIRLVAMRLPLERDAGLAHVVGNGVALVRYWDLPPELGRLIADLADKDRQRKWIDLNTHLIPDWYLAWAERPTGVMNPPGDQGKPRGEYIGSEYFLSSPIFSMSQFAAKALVLGDDGAILAKYVDIPWCRGDLYFISKCAWTLRAMDGWKYDRMK